MEYVLIAILIIVIAGAVHTFSSRFRWTIMRRLDSNYPKKLEWDKYIYKTRWRRFVLSILWLFIFVVSTIELNGDYVLTVNVISLVIIVLIEIIFTYKQTGSIFPPGFKDEIENEEEKPKDKNNESQ